MAKEIWLGGKDGTGAKKVKEIYVSIDGVARKVTHGFVGVNGKARCFYAPEQHGIKLVFDYAYENGKVYSLTHGNAYDAIRYAVNEYIKFCGSAYAGRTFWNTFVSDKNNLIENLYNRITQKYRDDGTALISIHFEPAGDALIYQLAVFFGFASQPTPDSRTVYTYTNNDYQYCSVWRPINLYNGGGYTYLADGTIEKNSSTYSANYIGTFTQTNSYGSDLYYGMSVSNLGAHFV